MPSLRLVGRMRSLKSPAAVHLVLAATGNNWSINMALFALSYFLGAVCRAFIDSDERLHE